MKFFISEAKDAVEAESVYEGIRKFHTEQVGASLSARRMYSVHGTHNRKRFTATVGQTFERLHEPVIAILLDDFVATGEIRQISHDTAIRCADQRTLARFDSIEDFDPPTP